MKANNFQSINELFKINHQTGFSPKKQEWIFAFYGQGYDDIQPTNLLTRKNKT
jgi:hypothetical protein